MGMLNKNRRVWITNMAGKVIGKEQRQLECIFKMQVKLSAQKIVSDQVHPHFKEVVRP